tara:strand:+ start:123 stop:809 length:687 start_codon:yes stop_codon:yes gene_type:complete
MKISIIVPVYNEEKTVAQVLKRLSNTKVENVEYEIIAINDGSTDGSKELLEKNKNYITTLINNERNSGKGFSVREGLKVATGEYILFQDADLEYDPIEFKKFIKVCNDFDADVVIGSRFNYSEYTRSHNILNKVGNKILTLTFNIIYNTTFTDVYSCYLCYKRKLVDPNKLKTNGFDQHAEILSEAVKKGKKYFEVPISYNGRSHEEGKKIKFYHFFSVIYRIILNRF